MQAGQPSRTALSVAAHRALHQIIDGGSLFKDPLAAPMLGVDPRQVLGPHFNAPHERALRSFVAARSRWAEDTLAAAVARGVRQYVVLGAGLDTFGHRNPYPGLRVIEVDHPATQVWKRERAASAGIVPPASLAFAGVDFETGTLAEGLAAAGFDPAAPALFAWLGVVMYLTLDAVMATLGYIAGLPDSEVVFDHGESPSAYREPFRSARVARERRLAAIGEPFLTYFDPPELSAKLAELGFSEVEDLGPRTLGPRYFGQAGREGPGSHLVRARR
jgi:methyltransferase (TIGR00027 family)